MKKILFVLALLSISVMLVGQVSAYMGYGGMNMGNSYYDSEDMILLNGEYNDLKDLRESTGMNVMPWIQNAEDFELAKQMETRMMNQWQSRSYSRPDYGYGMNRGYGMMGGCW
jgi:hypothetical protein